MATYILCRRDKYSLNAITIMEKKKETIKGKKEININVRIPPFLYKFLQEMVETGEYGNMSDVVRYAILEFKHSIEKKRREEERKADRIIELLRKNKELREKVLKALKEG